MSRSRPPSSSCCPEGPLPAFRLTGFGPIRSLLVAGTLLAGLAACGDNQDEQAAVVCPGKFTAIAAVQGEGLRSPLFDQVVAVSGIVTRVESGRGFYLQEPSQATRGASAAIYVEHRGREPSLDRVLAVSGRVAELGPGPDTLTSLIDSKIERICAEGAPLPIVEAGLPLDPDQREAFEGMRLAFQGGLAVTDTYRAREGEWTLSTGGPLRLPTEDHPPGEAAMAAERSNRQRGLRIALPGLHRPALPAGSVLGPIVGVLGHDGKIQRLFVEQAPAATPGPLAGLESTVDGRLRVVGVNLLNFFNGDGRGGGFPTERGARTPQEFEAQQRRTRAALARLQPHLLAVQELENDGFAEDSAARSLLQLLNDGSNDDWQVVDPGFGPIGGDVITVGLFYRAAILETVGGPQLLDAPPFRQLSRQPLAQLFRDRASGVMLLVVVNHLKSKGRCPDKGPNADQGDGQGCWNRARVEAVETLAPWIESLATELGTRKVLILGDMNAWRREEPIAAFRQAGYADLVASLSGLPQYSFLYFGQRGTLDYAFASPELLPHARQALIWHINADWPQGLPLPEPWLRMSDHDPVVVDFEFSQSATSN